MCLIQDAAKDASDPKENYHTTVGAILALYEGEKAEEEAAHPLPNAQKDMAWDHFEQTTWAYYSAEAAKAKRLSVVGEDDVGAKRTSMVWTEGIGDTPEEKNKPSALLVHRGNGMEDVKYVPW